MSDQERFRLTLAQLNPTVGDLDGNAAQAREAWTQGSAAGADLVALPEMFITGYQIAGPGAEAGLLYRPRSDAIDALAARTAPMARRWPSAGPGVEGTKLFNAYYICKGGQIAARVLKHHLPNDTVFDEVRIFDPGPMAGPIPVGSARIGTPICEDAWYPGCGRDAGRDRRRVPAGAQRLALLPRQVRRRG